MGGNTKMSFNEYVSTQISTSISSEVVTQQSSGVDATAVNLQYNKIEVGGTGCCRDFTTDDGKIACLKIIPTDICTNFDSNFTMGSTVKVVQENNQTVSGNFTSKINELIENNIKAVQDQLNQTTFPLPGGNVTSNTSIDVENSIKTSVSDVMKTENIQKIRNQTFNTQDNTVYLCAKMKSCKVSSSLMVDAFFNNIANQVISKISDNDLANQAYDYIATKQSQTKTDAFAILADAVGAFFRSIAGIILIVIIFLFLIIFIVIRVFFGHGSSSSSGPDLSSLAAAASSSMTSSAPVKIAT